MNAKLTIFMNLYRQAEHKVSKLVHTAKCRFYAERIALTSSIQKSNSLCSLRYPPKDLLMIYAGVKLSSLFVRHFSNNVGTQILFCNLLH